MNDPMEMLAKDAARRVRELEDRYIDDAIIGGATDAASLLDKPEVRDQVSRLGFMQAVAAQNADGIKPPQRPGPRRRAKKHPSRRQAVKAARKRSR